MGIWRVDVGSVHLWEDALRQDEKPRGGGDGAEWKSSGAAKILPRLCV